MKAKKSISKYVGHLIKNVPNHHELEFDRVFNLHETTFFQKMVPQEILEKGPRIEPENYLRALTFLSYYGRVIENNYNVCDNLVTISKALRKDEKEKGEDNQASYLDFKAVVLESALYTKERLMTKKKNSITSTEEKQLKKVYETEKATDLDAKGSRKPDLYYEAIGEIICSFVSEDNKVLLEKAKRRTELEAIVFTDSILPLLSKNDAKQVQSKLSGNNYFEASIAALNKLINQTEESDLRSLVFKDG
jgi:hypothetical protein